MTGRFTEDALHTPPRVVCQSLGGPKAHMHRPLVQVQWLRLIYGVLGTGRDFAAVALKKGHRALQRGWVDMITSPGPVGKDSRIRNGEVPS